MRRRIRRRDRPRAFNKLRTATRNFDLLLAMATPNLFSSSPALLGITSLANSNQCLLATAAGFFITGSLRPGPGRVRRHQGARIGGLMFREALEKVGAGEGNRTLVFSLEGCCSTIELHPHCMIRLENQCSLFRIMFAGSPNMPLGLSQLPSPACSLPILARSALNRRRLASYSHLSINNERR